MNPNQIDVLDIQFLITLKSQIKVEIMNTIIEKANYNQRKEKLKVRLSRLTDDDLMFAESQQIESYSQGRNKSGKNKSQMVRVRAAI